MGITNEQWGNLMVLLLEASEKLKDKRIEGFLYGITRVLKAKPQDTAVLQACYSLVRIFNESSNINEGDFEKVRAFGGVLRKMIEDMSAAPLAAAEG